MYELYIDKTDVPFKVHSGYLFDQTFRFHNNPKLARS